MTPSELRTCLDALQWTPGALARALGCHRNLPLQWLSGRVSVPESVAIYLDALADAHRRTPAPVWRVRGAA